MKSDKLLRFLERLDETSTLLEWKKIGNAVVTNIKIVARKRWREEVQRTLVQRFALRFSFKVCNGGAVYGKASGFPWRPPLNYPCNAHRGLRFNFLPSVSRPIDNRSGCNATEKESRGIALHQPLDCSLGLPQFLVWRSTAIEFVTHTHTHTHMCLSMFFSEIGLSKNSTSETL